jgi:dipeptidase D
LCPTQVFQKEKRARRLTMPRNEDTLQPEALWRYFFELCKYPRCSGNETQAVQYIVDIANSLSLPVLRDEYGNLVVRKPPTKGRESHTPVVLQSHLDMVCEKNKDTAFDFAKDPIPVRIKDSWVIADGTSLGADNGIGVAASLALLENRELSHPPVEALFTTQEETGLVGARKLDRNFVKGRTLLNLDSEEEGVVFVGCAGGNDTIGTLSVHTEKVDFLNTYLISVSGLRGGHSGIEIHKGRGNAIKTLARVLDELIRIDGVRIHKIIGGDKRNAIPRDSEAIVHLPGKKVGSAQKLVAQVERQLALELKSTDPGLKVHISDSKIIPTVDWAFTAAFQEKVIGLLLAIPHGVLAMSQDIDGLVETSTNLAAVESDEKCLTIQTSQRSSIKSAMFAAARHVQAVMELAGSETCFENSYPGWTPNMDSSVLDACRRVYKDLTGEDIKVKAVHAGLECGILGEKYEGMDMVSFGPTLQDVHSVHERVSIPSVERFWTFLLELLKSLR